MTTTKPKQYRREIDSLIRSGKFEIAEERLDEAIARYPEDSAIGLLTGKFLLATSTREIALEHFRNLLTTFPNNPAIEIELAKILIDENAFDAAQRHISSLANIAGNEKSVLSLQARIARKIGDTVTECAFLEAITKHDEEPNLAHLYRLATLHNKLLNPEASIAVAKHIQKLDPENISARFALAWAEKINGNESEAERHYLALIEAEPENPRWYAETQKYYLLIGNKEKAHEVLRCGLAKSLDSKELFSQILKIPVPTEIADRAIAWAERARHSCNSGEQRCSEEILFHFRPELFSHSPNTLSGQSDNSNSLKVADWLSLSPADSHLKRPILLERISSEVEIARAEVPCCIVIVFLGLAERAMLPVRVFDRFLAALNCTAIYVRDEQRMLGNLGIASLSHSFEGTVEYFRKLIAESGCGKLLTVGSSAGGYPAIRYGIALEAEAIISFSGPTNIDAKFLANDGRGKIVARRLQNLPENVRDTRPIINSASQSPAIHLIYGELNLQDSLHAKHIAKCPGVVLYPLKNYSGHDSIRHLAMQERLLPLLQKIINPL